MARIPYTYLIGWTTHNKWYYGVRYGHKCNPSDLWVNYFTSSKYVASFRATNGEPDVIEVRNTFTTAEKARIYESKVLRRMRVVKRDDFLNKSDLISYGVGPGDQNPMWGKHHTESHKQYMSQKMMGVHAGEASPYFGKTWEDVMGIEVATKKRLDCSNRTLGKNNPMYGKKHTKESKIKMALHRRSTLGELNPNARQIIIDGISYQTIQSACDILDLSYYKVRKILGDF